MHETNDDDWLATSLGRRLTDVEQRRIREFFETEPGTAADVVELQRVARLLRRRGGLGQPSE